MKERREYIDLIVDGLNLAHYVKNSERRGNTSDGIASHIVRMCKILYKEGFFVNQMLIIRGLDKRIFEQEEELKKLFSRKKEIEDRLGKRGFLQKIFGGGELEEELKQIEQQILKIQENLQAKFIYTKSFWDDMVKSLENTLRENNIRVKGIKSISVTLERKIQSKEEKIERDDDITISSIIGFLLGLKRNIAIYSNDKRLLEVSIKTIKELSGNLSRVVALTWGENVANYIRNRLGIPTFSIGEKGNIKIQDISI